jgi:hypothetical protein
MNISFCVIVNGNIKNGNICIINCINIYVKLIGIRLYTFIIKNSTVTMNVAIADGIIEN